MVTAIAKPSAPQQDQGVIQILTGAGLSDTLRGFPWPSKFRKIMGIQRRGWSPSRRGWWTCRASARGWRYSH